MLREWRGRLQCPGSRTRQGPGRVPCVRFGSTLVLWVFGLPVLPAVPPLELMCSCSLSFSLSFSYTAVFDLLSFCEGFCARVHEGHLADADAASVVKSSLGHPGLHRPHEMQREEVFCLLYFFEEPGIRVVLFLF